MTPDNVRLNYTISDSINDQLLGYCELTGRTASDLVRQLVSEVLEHDRTLPEPQVVEEFLREGERRDKRTDMWMSSRYLNALDEKLEEDGYPTKSGVIAYLLHDFLNTRANHASTEMVRVTTIVNRLTYAALARAASSRQQTVEGLVADLCENFVTLSEHKA
ncbi:MAG: hypothetical protein AB7L09_00295 [Nitrospira sp.]